MSDPAVLITTDSISHRMLIFPLSQNQSAEKILMSIFRRVGVRCQDLMCTVKNMVRRTVADPDPLLAPPLRRREKVEKN